jgi:hypothetical protein
MMQAALVLPTTTVGMIEASATRKLERPGTRSSWLTTAMGLAAGAIMQVQLGSKMVEPRGAGVDQHVVVAHLVGAGFDLLGDAGLERFGRGEAPCEVQAGDDGAPVGLGGVVLARSGARTRSGPGSFGARSGRTGADADFRLGFVRHPGCRGLVQGATARGRLGESVFKSALGFVRSRTVGERGPSRGRVGVHLQSMRRQRGVGVGGLLGLERLEGAQRAPELGIAAPR